MINHLNRKSYRPIMLVYVGINIIVFAGKPLWAEKWNMDIYVLMGGNTILFVATLASFVLYQKSLHNNNPQVFLRYIYGGMFLKMLVCLLAAFIYIAYKGKDINKPGLFGSMFFYFIYTFLEVSILFKLSKQQKNAQARSSS